MPKSKLTLLVDDALIKQMKHQAVEEERSVGEITGELWREYLKRAQNRKRADALTTPSALDHKSKPLQEEMTLWLEEFYPVVFANPPHNHEKDRIGTKRRQEANWQ
jgi:hypothetical protein